PRPAPAFPTRRSSDLWSPYSVASALGLAAAGARGRTYDELAAALAPGGDLAGLGKVLAESAAPRQAEAAVANTLWMRRQWRFLRSEEHTSELQSRENL